MGLYGNIVVAPAPPDYWPPVHRELSITLDDILLQLSLEARRGEVVRFYLTDTANSRVFNLGLPGARMKLVGGDSGRYERERLVERVLIAPSERAVVDVLFDEPGQIRLQHHTPHRTYTLATITVTPEPGQPSLAPHFGSLRANADMIAERERLAPYLDAEPDKTLALVAEMDTGEPRLPAGGKVAYGCPMDPEVFSDQPGRCPKCGMKLVSAQQLPQAADRGHPHEHSPFHIHGAGRFLILSRDGVVEPNLVWKDTVLVPTGQTVDLLLDVTNPGSWMAHCHIAEHHEGGMMFRFNVEA